MSRYIDNVNKFITVRKIKQTYVSMKSGIEIRKLSRNTPARIFVGT